MGFFNKFLRFRKPLRISSKLPEGLSELIEEIRKIVENFFFQTKELSRKMKN